MGGAKLGQAERNRAARAAAQEIAGQVVEQAAVEVQFVGAWGQGVGGGPGQGSRRFFVSKLIGGERNWPGTQVHQPNGRDDRAVGDHRRDGHRFGKRHPDRVYGRRRDVDVGYRDDAGIVVGVGHRNVARVNRCVDGIVACYRAEDDRIRYVAVGRGVIHAGDGHGLRRVPVVFRERHTGAGNDSFVRVA